MLMSNVRALMSVADHIVGAEKVVEALGYWPSFHDAEVISFCIERALPLKKEHTPARLSVHIRHYESVGEGTAQYELVLRKSLLLRLLFNRACDIELTDFNFQNVINSISVSTIVTDEPATLLVDIEPIWGFGGSLRCSSIEVEAVEVLPV